MQGPVAGQEGKLYNVQTIILVPYFVAEDHDLQRLLSRLMSECWKGYQKKTGLLGVSM
jgi:hypothetical protein